MANKERNLIAFFALGLSALLILRDVAGFGISKYIYLAFVVGLMAIAKYDSLIYMLCFVFPLVCGLPGTYIMPCVLLLLVIKKGSISIWQLGMILFVTIMEIVAAWWYPIMDLPAMVQYVSYVSVMFFLINDEREVDYEFCVCMYLYGTCVLCGTILVTGLMTAPPNWMELFGSGHFRFGETQSDVLEGMKLSLNANSLAYYSVTGMCCGIFAAERANGKKKVLYLLLTLATTIVGYLTLSRSWVLVVAICLLIYMSTKITRFRKFVGLLLVAACLLLVIEKLFFEKNPELLSGIITRLTGNDIKTGNGRTEVFWDYMNIFLSDPKRFLIGTGVTQYRTALGLETAMHNGTQQVLICYGLIGTIVFVIGILRGLLMHMCWQKRGTAISWLPLVGVALFAQTIQFLNPMMLMLPLIIGVFATKSRRPVEVV